MKGTGRGNIVGPVWIVLGNRGRVAVSANSGICKQQLTSLGSMYLLHDTGKKHEGEIPFLGRADLLNMLASSSDTAYTAD